jgi:hypothetical protein
LLSEKEKRGNSPGSLSLTALTADLKWHDDAMPIAIDDPPLNPAVAAIIPVVSIGRIAVTVSIANAAES